MDIATEISNLINMVDGIPDKDVAFINELLEHDEWGVALETLCAVISEEGIPINKEAYNKLCEIGKTMNMDSNTWKNL